MIQASECKSIGLQKLTSVTLTLNKAKKHNDFETDPLPTSAVSKPLYNIQDFVCFRNQLSCNPSYFSPLKKLVYFFLSVNLPKYLVSRQFFRKKEKKWLSSAVSPNIHFNTQASKPHNAKTTKIAFLLKCRYVKNKTKTNLIATLFNPVTVLAAVQLMFLCRVVFSATFS